MTGEQWLFLLLVSVFLGLMLVFSLNTPVKSPLYRLARRFFWAFCMVSFCRLFGWMGMNGMNLFICTALGLPGCAVLAMAGIL